MKSAIERVLFWTPQDAARKNWLVFHRIDDYLKLARRGLNPALVYPAERAVILYVLFLIVERFHPERPAAVQLLSPWHLTFVVSGLSAVALTFAHGYRTWPHRSVWTGLYALLERYEPLDREAHRSLKNALRLNIMQIIKSFGLIASLIATSATAAEESWLETEIRAQEARWEAQREKTAPLEPVGGAARWLSESANGARRAGRVAAGERAVRFPSLAARAQAKPKAATAAAFGPGAVSPPAERAGDHSRTIAERAALNRLDPLLIRAVILTESAGRSRARSPKGAIGLMQLMPKTARRFGVNPRDPAQNIDGGTRYLRWLLDRFDGDVRLALAGYNAGEGAVDKYGGIPPYRETRNYVTRVLGYHEALRQTASNRSQ